jgi:hypothetical protein
MTDGGRARSPAHAQPPEPMSPSTEEKQRRFAELVGAARGRPRRREPLGVHAPDQAGQPGPRRPCRSSRRRRRAGGLGLDAQQYGLVPSVDGRDRLEGKNEPSSEQPSAHDEVVGVVGVAFVANVIEACEGAPLRVQNEAALGRGEQPADLALLS